MKIAGNIIAASCMLAGSLMAQGGGSGGGGGTKPPAPVGTVTSPELRIFDVTAPPGGVALIRIGLTTPMPIISGSAAFDFDQGALMDVAGISLLGDYSSVTGVAVRSAGQLKMQFTSTTGTFGTYADIPIMIIKIPVSPAAKIGNKYRLFFNGLTLTGPNGTYTATFKPGTFTVGGFSVNQANPRVGMVNPGQTVTFSGTNFVRPMTIHSTGPRLTNINVIDSNTLTFTTIEGFNMEGTEFDLINGDKARSTDVFFSYRKGELQQASQVPLIAASDPIFSSTTYSQAKLNLVAGNIAPANLITGVAIQNPGLIGTMVEVRTLDATGTTVGSRRYFLPQNGLLLESIQELVPNTALNYTGSVKIESSSSPVQILGLLGNKADNSVAPVMAVAVP